MEHEEVKSVVFNQNAQPNEKSKSFFQQKNSSKLMEESFKNSRIEPQNDSQAQFNSRKRRDKKILEYTAKVKQIHRNYFDDNEIFEDKEFPALNKYLFDNES